MRFIALIVLSAMWAGCAVQNPPPQAILPRQTPGAILEGEDLPSVIPSVKVQNVTKQPRPIQMINPEYSFAMRKNGISGEVILEFIVAKDGTVPRATVVYSPHPLLGNAALAAIYKWKFEPGEVNGVKVNTLIQVPVKFDLLDRKQ